MKKINTMTHTEDIKRIMTKDYQDYLYNRIEALERRVEFLEAQIEISNQVNLKQ